MNDRENGKIQARVSHENTDSQMKWLFSHVREWVFDLDNTLYPGHCDLNLQIDRRITRYVMRIMSREFDEARKWQKYYYREYGTTLRGLMNDYGVNPYDYLDYVHDIDYSSIPANPELGELIDELPGRKYIFTNSDMAHAQRTLTALNIGKDIFAGVFDVVQANFVPKPEQASYDRFLRANRIDPCCAAMFEDMPRNLEIPSGLGMSTILITPTPEIPGNRETREEENRDGNHIDHVSDNVNHFISQIINALKRYEKSDS